MATTLIASLSSNLKLPLLSAISSSPSTFRRQTQTVPFSNSPIQTLWLNPTRNCNVISHNRSGFLISRKLESFTVFAADFEAQSDDREESTMPERFRYLAKEGSDPPVRWPFFVGKLFYSLCFLFFLVVLDDSESVLFLVC